MDIELKNQSVVEIGKAVGDNVNTMIPQSRTFSAGWWSCSTCCRGNAYESFDSMMVVLSDIRDGIYSLVDKFSEGVSLQMTKIQDQPMLLQDLAQVGGGEDTLSHLKMKQMIEVF